MQSHLASVRCCVLRHVAHLGLPQVIMCLTCHDIDTLHFYVLADTTSLSLYHTDVKLRISSFATMPGDRTL